MTEAITEQSIKAIYRFGCGAGLVVGIHCIKSGIRVVMLAQATTTLIAYAALMLVGGAFLGIVSTWFLFQSYYKNHENEALARSVSTLMMSLGIFLVVIGCLQLALLAITPLSVFTFVTILIGLANIIYSIKLDHGQNSTLPIQSHSIFGGTGENDERNPLISGSNQHNPATGPTSSLGTTQSVGHERALPPPPPPSPSPTQQTTAVP